MYTQYVFRWKSISDSSPFQERKKKLSVVGNKNVAQGWRGAPIFKSAHSQYNQLNTYLDDGFMLVPCKTDEGKLGI